MAYPLSNPADIVGQTFHELTVLEYIGKQTICIKGNGKEDRRHMYKCLCSCGKECTAHRDQLLRGKKKSCGHIIHNRPKDLVGKTFGKLTVLEYHHSTSYGIYYLCQCTCGTKKLVLASSLRTGATVSCGCQQEESRHKAKTHGLSKTRIYSIWRHMKQRCNNPNETHYDDYGGRGIFVCDAWNNSFEQFYADMKDSYYQAAEAAGGEQFISIDRINNDDGYYKENCRWATKDIQNYNKRSTRNMEYNGLIYPETIMCEKFGNGIQPETLIRRLDLGYPIDFALATPPLKSGERLETHYQEYHKNLHPEGWCPIEFLDDDKGV